MARFQNTFLELAHSRCAGLPRPISYRRFALNSPTVKSSGIKYWLRSIGPGLVSACVVIGPGSILASSQVGATNGFALAWVIVIAVACMMVYMTLAAKLGVVTGRSSGDLVTEKLGRPLAIVIGASVFFITAAYQFGNNLGVHSAILSLIEIWTPATAEATAEPSIWIGVAAIVTINGLAIAFLFAFKDLYKALERLMMVFVALMLLAFVVNLAFARPDPVEMAKGFIPRLTRPNGESVFDLSLLGMIGTTFVIAAAYYQSYLVRFKGWKVEQLGSGLIDARVGALVMACITLMIMANAAAVFHQPPAAAEATETVQQVKFASVGDVAVQLEKAFGPVGQTLFCVGLLSAATSSFLVNAVIGGFMLADGLGLANKPDDWRPRVFTVVNLLIGMIVGLIVLFTGVKPVVAIIAAQAITVVASPLLAGVLWWLTSRRDLMGSHANSPAMHVGAAIGFLLLLGIAALIVFDKIPATFKKLQPAIPAVIAPLSSVEQTGDVRVVS